MDNKPQRSRAYKIANIIGFVLLFLIIAGVVAYFSSNKPKSNSSLEIAVFKGPISGATVNIYALNDNGEKGDLIKGPLTSDAFGNVIADLPANLPKRLLIESSGGSYKNEANGQTIQLKNSDTLTAVLPASAKTAAVTPFTYMAAFLAKSLIQGGALPDEAVISANETIAKQYGVRSILDTLPVDASNESIATQGSLEAKQYGLLLAGFAQLAKNLNVRSADLANAFAKDWSDGAADGAEDGQLITISGSGKLGNASSKGLSDAVKQFAESNKNYSGINEGGVSLNNPASATIGLRITGASLPVWVSGKKGSYGLEAKGGSLPLVWSVINGTLPDGFSLSKDGILSGIYTLSSGVTKKIFSPFTATVKDQTGKTQSVVLSITVAPEAPKIIVTNPPILIVGQSYDVVIARASGGLPPYTFVRETASGPLPMGMQITNDGRLTGSPKAKGNFSFSVCVVDDAKTEKCGSIVLKVSQEQEAPVATPTPATSAKDQPETWQGTITTSGRCECSSASHGCDPYGNGGELTGSFTFSFILPGSMAKALKSSGPYEPGNPGEGQGTFNGAETVATQSNRNDCQLAGGSVSNIPITVVGRSSAYYPGYIALVSFDTSDNPEGQKGLMAGGWITDNMSNGGSAPGGQISGMSLLISSISETQMSGKVSFTDPGTGTFTLTKVK